MLLLQRGRKNPSLGWLMSNSAKIDSREEKYKPCLPWYKGQGDNQGGREQCLGNTQGKQANDQAEWCSLLDLVSTNRNLQGWGAHSISCFPFLSFSGEHQRKVSVSDVAQ